MVFLSDLPKDALVGITDLLSPQSIGRLCLSGDSRLNKHLTSGGGVESFSLALDPLFYLRWPSLVRQFAHLRRFSINTMYRSYTPKWQVNLLDLSHTVRHIRLNFEDSLSSFVSAISTSPSLFPNLEELSVMASPQDASALFAYLKNRDNFLILRLDLSDAYDLRLSDLPRNLKIGRAHV